MGLGLVVKIAWRNMWRHKGKSLVIGIILFFGALLMTVGSGVIAGMEAGLQKNIIQLFSGDIVVISNQHQKNNILFDLTSGKPIKIIKNYGATQKVLESQSAIRDFIPVTAGMVAVLNSQSEMGQMMLLGVDIGKYRQFFPGNFRITEGRCFKPGERGLLVSEEARKSCFDTLNFWLLPAGAKLERQKLPGRAQAHLRQLDLRNDLVFMGTSSTSSIVDVRTPVVGTFNFRSLNKVWGLYSIVDIESFREAYQYVTAENNQTTISEEQKKLLQDSTYDQLFTSAEGTVGEISSQEADLSSANIRRETQRKAGGKADPGSYNAIFVKLKKGETLQPTLQSLNQAFERSHLNVKAVSWKDAVGSVGSMAIMIKSALNLFIMFIFFVAIIIIMNTLSMAALERVTEIGMMRAIGAQRGFLRRTFFCETGFLALLFGGLGIGIGIILIALLGRAGITSSNEVLQLVYGGDTFAPLFTFPDLVAEMIQLGMVTLLAALYPLRLIGHITPLDAIIRD